MRIPWIDQYKGFLAIVTVIGHTIVWSQLTKEFLFVDFIYFFIYSFHMPAFFVLSGIVGEKVNYERFGKPLVTHLLRRATNLLVPTILFSCIYAITLIIFSSFSIYEGISKTVHNYWFIYVMILVNVGYPILKLILKKDIIVTVIVFLLTIGVGLINNTAAKVFGYTLCYCAGVLAHDAAQKNEKLRAMIHTKRIRMASIFCMTAGVAVILGFYLAFGTDLDLNVYYKTFMGLLISFILIPLFCGFKKLDCLDGLGRLTLQIYLIHFALISWIQFHIPSVVWVSIVSFICMTVVSVYLPVGCEKLLGNSKIYHIIFKPYQCIEKYLPQIFTQS